jgi:trimethylamine--corrinoid protein Co-methyltransferase
MKEEVMTKGVIESGYQALRSPFFKTLGEDQIRTIHNATLEILERIGVMIGSPEAVRLLKDAGCKVVEHKGQDVVKIPSRVVEDAIKSAPGRIQIFDRNGQRAMSLEGRKSYYSTTGGSPFVFDPRTGERREALKKDVVDAAVIQDYLENIDMLFEVASSSNEYPMGGFLHTFEAMLTNSTKPITFLAEDKEDLEKIIEMAALAAGGLERLQEKPSLVFYDESISPLYSKKNVLEKIMYCAEIGIPVRYGPLVMIGGNTPITMAGALAQVNAESLAGLTVCQLKRRGAPFVIGGIFGVMDMKKGLISIGSPEMCLLQSAYSDIAKWYDVPNFGTAGTSDSKIVDEQAAMEWTMTTFSTAISGCNLNILTAALESFMSVAFEGLVMADEIIGYTKRIMRSIEINDETLAVDLLAKVGPGIGGSFLTEEHTYKHFKQEQWAPTICDRGNWHSWEKQGRKRYSERLTDKVREILETHKPDPLPDTVVKKIKAIVKK